MDSSSILLSVFHFFCLRFIFRLWVFLKKLKCNYWNNKNIERVPHLHLCIAWSHIWISLFSFRQILLPISISYSSTICLIVSILVCNFLSFNTMKTIDHPVCVRNTNVMKAAAFTKKNSTTEWILNESWSTNITRNIFRLHSI